MSMSEAEKRKLGFDTRCIHSGMAVDRETNVLKRPIVLGNSFKLADNMAELPDAFDWNISHSFNYPRLRHPSARYLEERLAALEGGEDCQVFATGVAAIAGTFFSLLNAGDHIVSSRLCYIGVHEFLEEHLGKRFGVRLTLVDTTDLDAVRNAVEPDTKIIHIETPANPTTDISDIAGISEIARQGGALLTVDSTFSGMVTQRPLELGADLVIHSLTKYINGHGDGMGGAVIGPKALIRQIQDAATVHLGASISPFNAWLISRSIETLPLRMQKHSDNAMKLARFLESHPKVKFIRYPGLESHRQHEIARKQMSDFSAMINFGIKTDDPMKYFDFLKSMKIISHAVCLGHTESLIQFYPQTGDHPELGALNYPEDVGEGFLRFSVGLEDADDLMADLDQALAAVN